MYDLDNDDRISREELLAVLHMMVGANISEEQVSDYHPDLSQLLCLLRLFRMVKVMGKVLFWKSHSYVTLSTKMW